jgi:hypothetical protein
MALAAVTGEIDERELLPENKNDGGDLRFVWRMRVQHVTRLTTKIENDKYFKRNS